MKKLWLVLISVLSLYFSGITIAATVTESVYGTLEFTYGNWNTATHQIGTEYHLFDVTFDNEHFQYTAYNRNSGFTSTIQASADSHLFNSNTEFNLGDVIYEAIDQSPRDDYYIELKSYAYSQFYPETWAVFRKYESVSPDFRLQASWNYDLASVTWYTTDGGRQMTNVIRFDNLRMVSPSQVPVPSSLILLGLGCLSLIGYRRKI